MLGTNTNCVMLSVPLNLLECYGIVVANTWIHFMSLWAWFFLHQNAVAAVCLQSQIPFFTILPLPVSCSVVNTKKMLLLVVLLLVCCFSCRLYGFFLLVHQDCNNSFTPTRIHTYTSRSARHDTNRIRSNRNKLWATTPPTNYSTKNRTFFSFCFHIPLLRSAQRKKNAPNER